MGSCVTHRPTPGTWEISQREPGPPFLSNQEITPPTGGPLPCSWRLQGKYRDREGFPCTPAFLSHPNYPLCLGSSAIFHSWWSSWRRRPRSCWWLGKWKDAVERTRPIAKVCVGKAQPWTPEPEATSNPSLQGRNEQNRQPFLGPPALLLVILPVCGLLSFALLSSSPLSVCARTARPPTVVKPGKSTTHVNV